MKSIKIQDLQMTFELLTNLKLLVNEISNNEIKHIDPLRMKITLKGLIDAEEKRMTEYKAGIIPEILSDINDLIDLSNEVMYGKYSEKAFILSVSLENLKEKISREFIGDVE